VENGLNELCSIWAIRATKFQNLCYLSITIQFQKGGGAALLAPPSSEWVFEIQKRVMTKCARFVSQGFGICASSFLPLLDQSFWGSWREKEKLKLGKFVGGWTKE